MWPPPRKREGTCRSVLGPQKPLLCIDSGMAFRQLVFGEAGGRGGGDEQHRIPPDPPASAEAERRRQLVVDMESEVEKQAAYLRLGDERFADLQMDHDRASRSSHGGRGDDDPRARRLHYLHQPGAAQRTLHFLSRKDFGNASSATLWRRSSRAASRSCIDPLSGLRSVYRWLPLGANRRRDAFAAECKPFFSIAFVGTCRRQLGRRGGDMSRGGAFPHRSGVDEMLATLLQITNAQAQRDYSSIEPRVPSNHFAPCMRQQTLRGRRDLQRLVHR